MDVPITLSVEMVLTGIRYGIKEFVNPTVNLA